MMSTIQNKKTKYDNYPIVDSIAKGGIIDGGTTLTLLPIIIFTSNLPKGIGYASTTTFVSIPVIFGTAVISSIFAAFSYLERTNARENNNTYTGAISAGSFKYLGRELANSYLGLSNPLELTKDMKKIKLTKLNELQKQLALKAVIGAANAAEYEVCNDYGEICANNYKTALVFSSIVETSESLVLYGPTLTNGAIGLAAGVIGTTCAYQIFVPNIENFHTAYDYLEDRYLAYFQQQQQNFADNIFEPTLNQTLSAGVMMLNYTENLYGKTYANNSSLTHDL